MVMRDVVVVVRMHDASVSMLVLHITLDALNGSLGHGVITSVEMTLPPRA